MKKLLLTMALFLAAYAYSQEIPLPQRCFPLNGANPEDAMSGAMADVYGKVYAFTDRFGESGRAISFDKENGYLSFPLTSANGEARTAATLTYWMYVGNDSVAQTFRVKDDSGNLLLGMGKRGERAVLNIYHKDRNQEILPDLQWLWSDSNFTEGKGWYFVAVAYSEEGTYFYLTTPKGKMTECYSAFVPDWNLMTSMCIGTLDGIPADGMDDFKLYGAALSREQVSVLYQSESQLGMGEDALFNAATDLSLLSSEWYFHCTGGQGSLMYVLQKRSDHSFLSADAGYALSMVTDVESDAQRWLLDLVEDTSKGSVFTVANAATGMHVTGVPEGTVQRVADNSDSQRWYMGRWERGDEAKGEIRNANLALLKEEIYYDKDAGAVRIHVVFPESEDVKVKLIDSQGALISELHVGNVQFLDKSISLKTNGIYLLMVESADYRLNKKILVNY